MANRSDDEFRLWWLGQSGFLLQWNRRHLLLDPYLADSLARKYAGTPTPHLRMTALPVKPGKNLHPKLDVMSVAEGGLESYAQYPDSDCRNGAVIRVKNGPALVRSLASHHYLLTTGHNQSDIQMIGNILDFSIEAL